MTRLKPPQAGFIRRRFYSGTVFLRRRAGIPTGTATDYKDAMSTADHTYKVVIYSRTSTRQLVRIAYPYPRIGIYNM